MLIFLFILFLQLSFHQLLQYLLHFNLRISILEYLTVDRITLPRLNLLRGFLIPFLHLFHSILPPCMNRFRGSLHVNLFLPLISLLIYLLFLFPLLFFHQFHQVLCFYRFHAANRPSILLHKLNHQHG